MEKLSKLAGSKIKTKKSIASPLFYQHGPLKGHKVVTTLTIATEMTREPKNRLNTRCTKPLQRKLPNAAERHQRRLESHSVAQAALELV